MKVQELLDKASYHSGYGNKEWSTASVMYCGDCGHHHRKVECECGCPPNDDGHLLFVAICDQGEPGPDREFKALVQAALSSINEGPAVRRKVLGYPEDAKLTLAR